MVPSFRDEISTRPAGTDFTLRLHGENNVYPGKGEQVSTWYLFTKNPQITIDLKIFTK